MPYGDDITGRLGQLKQLLDECHAAVPAAAPGGVQNEAAAARLAARLSRIRRLTDMLRSRIDDECDVDALDHVTMRFLLDNYSDALNELRSSAERAAQRLRSVTAAIADGTRIVREDAKRRRRVSTPEQRES